MLEFGGTERGEIMSDTTRQQAVIQSVSRAASILKCFYGATELGLSEISRMLGLHKSTAAGIINTLKVEGFLEQNEQTGKLRLGLELFSLAVVQISTRRKEAYQGQILPILNSYG